VPLITKLSAGASRQLENLKTGYEPVAIHDCTAFLISIGVLPTVTLEVATCPSHVLNKMIIKFIIAAEMAAFQLRIQKAKMNVLLLAKSSMMNASNMNN
jgi:hypothetical protein